MIRLGCHDFIQAHREVSEFPPSEPEGARYLYLWLYFKGNSQALPRPRARPGGPLIPNLFLKDTSAHCEAARSPNGPCTWSPGYY